MAAVSTFVIAGAALAVGAAAYGSIKQAEEAKKMRKNAEATAAQQYKDQQALMNEQREQAKKEAKDREDAATQVRNESINSAMINRRNRGSNFGQKADIMTSPLGSVAQGQTAAKTALGA